MFISKQKIVFTIDYLNPQSNLMIDNRKKLKFLDKKQNESVPVDLNIDSRTMTLQILFETLYASKGLNKIESIAEDLLRRPSFIDLGPRLFKAIINPYSNAQANELSAYNMQREKLNNLKNLIEKQNSNSSKLKYGISSWLIRVNIIELKYFDIYFQNENFNNENIYFSIQIGDKTYKTSKRSIKNLVFNEVDLFKSYISKLKLSKIVQSETAFQI